MVLARWPGPPRSLAIDFLFSTDAIRMQWKQHCAHPKAVLYLQLVVPSILLQATPTGVPLNPCPLSNTALRTCFSPITSATVCPIPFFSSLPTPSHVSRCTFLFPHATPPPLLIQLSPSRGRPVSNPPPACLLACLPRVWTPDPRPPAPP